MERGQNATSASPDPNRFSRLAEPVLQFVDQLGILSAGKDEAQLVATAATLLQEFGKSALRDGAVPNSVPPARFALAVLIDQAARSDKKIMMKPWAAGAHRLLFDGRDMSVSSLREFHHTALNAGDEYRDLAEFLAGLLDRLEQKRTHRYKRGNVHWVLSAGLAVGALVAGLAGYALFLDYRYNTRLYQAFRQDALATGLDLVHTGNDLALRLDDLKTAAERTVLAAGQAPLGQMSRSLGFNAGVRAVTDYQTEVDRVVPLALAGAVNAAISVEGENLAAYDTLRAWSILSGQSDWSAAYLAGWVQDRSELLPQYRNFSTHAARLSGATTGLPPPDAELMEQARGFAAEAVESDRAYLELLRSEPAQALPVWQPDQAIARINEIMQRRSGVAIDAPVSGIFTASGWTYARDIGAGTAVQKARQEAANLFDAPLPQQNDAPDKVLDQLQHVSLGQWKAWLADLRVRPFTDSESAVLISGRLSAADSPLTQLLNEIWKQAGGTDRRRSHNQQIRLATEFGPMIQYVEQGKMKQIAGLFGALNVALGATDADEEAGMQRLMSIRDRANSVSALRQAPPIVVQIVEDVLAQTSAAHSDLLSNPITGYWQNNIFPQCGRVANGRFPFADGADSDPGEFAALLGPSGLITRFFRSQLEPLMDTQSSPWRWRPEARFAGLSPESAVFFQRALAISDAYFDDSGQLSAPLQLAALAERGQAFIMIGGREVSLRATSDPETIFWPGPEPETGVLVNFKVGNEAATLQKPGPWGLLRMLDEVHLRKRDEGRRFLVDLRASGGRVFVEMLFEKAANPVSGRALLQGFSCPATL